jgi:hypothetical protein
MPLILSFPIDAPDGQPPQPPTVTFTSFVAL